LLFILKKVSVLAPFRNWYRFKSIVLAPVSYQSKRYPTLGRKVCTHPGQALVLLPLCVLQPLHQLGVAQQVPVQRAVLGQAEVGHVLGQGGALVVALVTTTNGKDRVYFVVAWKYAVVEYEYTHLCRVYAYIFPIILAIARSF